MLTGNTIGGLALLSLLLFLGGASSPVSAQSPVAIGAPITGEVVLNRNVEVRIGPSADSRIVMTLDRGRALNALGTPRGTSWTQVAIGGQPIGYVPADALDPAFSPRPAADAPPAGAGAAESSATAAVVPRNAWNSRGKAERAKGFVVAVRDIAATEIRSKDRTEEFTITAGTVAGLVDVANGRAELALPRKARVVAPMEGFLGVAASYPFPGMAPVGFAPLFAARLGEYVSHDEAMRAWRAFVAGPGVQFADHPPMIWPVIRGGRAAWQAGFGPFTAVELDNLCPALALKGVDCQTAPLRMF